jgi:hypothetical protein
MIIVRVNLGIAATGIRQGGVEGFGEGKPRQDEYPVNLTRIVEQELMRNLDLNGNAPSEV